MISELSVLVGGEGIDGCVEEVSEEGGEGLSLGFLMFRVLLICSISAASTDICCKISWDIAELSPWAVWGQCPKHLGDGCGDDNRQQEYRGPDW